jgi:predicted Ser/Thr protein kinase
MPDVIYKSEKQKYISVVDEIVDIKKAEKIFKDIQYKKVHQTDVFVSDKLEKIVLKNCGFINPEDIEDAIGNDAYFALNKVLTKMSQEELIEWLEEVIRFIAFYLDNAQNFRNTGKKDLIELLTANKFTQPDRLLSMSIWTLTKDHSDDLLKKLDVEKKKLDTLNADTPDKMYRRELNELKL